MELGGDSAFAGLARKAAATPDRLFATFAGEPIPFSLLHRRSDAVAAGLRALGLEPGDRVAVMLENSPEAVALVFGMAKAGLVWVPVNARQRGDGLRHVLDHAGPRALVAEAALLPVAAASGAALAGMRIVGHGGDGPDGRLEAMVGSGAAFAEPPPPDAALFAIMYTSGTTGPPKGVMVTHRMMAFAGEAVAEVSAARPGDVFHMWEPLYHIGGSQMMLLPLIRDVTLAMVTRFSAGRFWDEVREAGATHMHYLGGILQILLKQPPSAAERAHGVRIAWGGGCPRDIWRAVEARFGVEVRECYGMTEASSITTMNTAQVLGAVGRPTPWFRVTIADAEGRPLPAGTRGEILVETDRPGALFSGYYRDPAATARTLRDGVLHTGDAGTIDADGNMVFHGRLTDSVRCRGENVSAWEVEHVAAAHPEVEDCAMIGVAAEIGEQDIKLFVQPKPGAALDPAALSAWLGPRLADHANPRYIALVEAFERTPSQRIMKHRLPRDLAGIFDRLAAATPAPAGGSGRRHAPETAER